MAKKQTRKTVSLNRALYFAAVDVAAKEGIALSEWVTRLIRAAIPEAPATFHASAPYPEPPRVVVHVPNATPVPPSELAARKEEQAATIAKLQRPPRDGDPAKTDSICAVCVDRPGVTLRALGRDNALVAVCAPCEDEPSNSGRYSFESGGGGGAESRLDRLNGTRRR